MPRAAASVLGRRQQGQGGHRRALGLRGPREGQAGTWTHVPPPQLPVLELAVRGIQGFPWQPSPWGCSSEGPSGVARLDLGLRGWTLRAGRGPRFPGSSPSSSRPAWAPQAHGPRPVLQHRHHPEGDRAGLLVQGRPHRPPHLRPPV